MQKYHKSISVIIGLIYSLLLFKFSVAQPVFRFLAPAFLVFCAAVFYYNRYYLKSVNKYNVWILTRSVFLFFSGLAIFTLLPNGFFRGVFLTSCFFVISFFELALGNFSENLMLDETLLVIFGLFLGFTAAEQYFPYLHEVAWHLGNRQIFSIELSLQPLYLAGIFFSSLLLARSFYDFIPQGPKTKWTVSVVLGLFSAELFWALTFLPLHYSALALILFCFFYFCLILNYYNLFQSLTLKKIQFHLLLIVAACGIAVLATPWKIIN